MDNKIGWHRHLACDQIWMLQGLPWELALGIRWVLEWLRILMLDNRNNQRGIILVTTLGMLGLLTFLILNLVFRIQLFLTLTDYRADVITADALLQSGLARALWAIRRDGNTQVDSRNDSWGSTTIMGEEGLLPAEFRDQYPPAVQWSIVDEESKLNVNTISQPLLRELLNQYYENEIPGERIAAFISDWLDSDNYGSAETDYYVSLPHSYAPRNAKIKYLEELLSIREVTPRLFYGKYRNEDEAVNDEDRSPPGLRDLLTIYTDGTVNVNTIPSATLEALLRAVSESDKTQSLVQEIDRARTGPDNILGTPDDIPFRTITDLTRITGAAIYQQAKRMGAPLGIASGAFTISVSVSLIKLNLIRHRRGLVLRKDGNIRLIYWREERS